MASTRLLQGPRAPGAAPLVSKVGLPLVSCALPVLSTGAFCAVSARLGRSAVHYLGAAAAKLAMAELCTRLAWSALRYLATLETLAMAEL